MRLDAEFLERLAAAPDHYALDTTPDDLAVLQYTSGTTRALPEAVRHTHRAVVTLMIAALYGLDRKSTRLNSSHIQKSRMPSSA